MNGCFSTVHSHKKSSPHPIARFDGVRTRDWISSAGAAEPVFPAASKMTTQALGRSSGT